jgi:hypothetical protein
VHGVTKSITASGAIALIQAMKVYDSGGLLLRVVAETTVNLTQVVTLSACSQ